MENDHDHINAMPTKAFFVDMLVRDIPLERAVLDLIDNCIDGARRLRPGATPDFSELKIKITFDADHFEISDNCGGFGVAIAENYAFRFGRPREAEQTEYSIGQFGVGMKRALFKFGRSFHVSSTTEHERWSMHVDVNAWEHDEGNWYFQFDDILAGGFDSNECGTRIVVNALRPEVSSMFSSPQFAKRLLEMIRTHQGQFVAYGLSIELLGDLVTKTEVRIRSGGKFTPSTEEFVFDEDSSAIHVRIVAGVSEPSPRTAGWYVVCNGRMILSADRTRHTGWGTVGEYIEATPKYHNDFARFRGIVFFSCTNSRNLPWNTTKTGLDDTAPVWQKTFPRLLDHSRSVIRFLSSLAKDIQDHGRERSPLLAALDQQTTLVRIDDFVGQGDTVFTWDQEPRSIGPRTVRIQYSREEYRIRELMDELDVGSAKAVGEASFDLIYEDFIGEG